jgi:hypothetical protein
MVLFDTDHGFNLAAAFDGPSVARLHGDGLDRLVWEERGRPRSFRHHYGWDDAGGHETITPLHFDPRSTAQLPIQLEAESLWPPRAQTAGWGWPSHFSAPCVSAGRALEIQAAEPGRSAEVRLALPSDLAGRRLRVQVWQSAQEPRESHSIIAIYADGLALAEQPLRSVDAVGCHLLQPMDLPAGRAQLEMRVVTSGRVVVDRLSAEPQMAPEIR